MRIAVCVKQVPVMSALTLDPETRSLRREGVPTEVSSFDIRALLKAVEIRSESGGAVTVVTMGPPQAREALEYCLALGADSAIHLCDPAFAGADTLATAHALAAGLRPHRFDLILCGRNSVDAETAQVGPQVAQLLGIPHVSQARAVTLQADAATIRVAREVDDGIEIVDVTEPCLITAGEDLAAERFPSAADQAAAQTKPITVLAASDISVTLDRFGKAGSPTWVANLVPAPDTRTPVMLAGETPIDAIEQLAGLLVEKHAIFGQAAAEHETSDSALDPPPAPGTVTWVVAETLGGKLRPVSFELLGMARRIADTCGGRVGAILFSYDPVHSDALATRGADDILRYEIESLDAARVELAAAVIANAIRTHHPDIVLAPSTTFGRDVMPRVAAQLGLGLTGDCIGLAFDAEHRLRQLKPAFGGSVIAPILSRTNPQMATIRPGMLPVAKQRPSHRATILDLPAIADSGTPAIRVIERKAESDVGADLDRADVVVGVGMGIGDWGNFARVEPLVELLGASICTTRDVTDAGWLPKQRQVGITGRAIAPRIYIAIGIRGAMEHMVGVRRAGTILAINKSPKAPVFKACDYGLVGDYAEIVPALTEALKRRRPAKP